MGHPLVRDQGTDLHRRLRPGHELAVVGGVEPARRRRARHDRRDRAAVRHRDLARHAEARLPGGCQTNSLFYVADPNQLTASRYVERLKRLAAVAAETPKL